MNIGNVYTDQGKYEEALVELKKGLDVLVAVHSQEHRTWPRPVTTLVRCTERATRPQSVILIPRPF